MDKEDHHSPASNGVQCTDALLLHAMILLEDAQHMEPHDKDNGRGAQKIEIWAFVICIHDAYGSPVVLVAIYSIAQQFKHGNLSAAPCLHAASRQRPGNPVQPSTRMPGTVTRTALALCTICSSISCRIFWKCLSECPVHRLHGPAGQIVVHSMLKSFGIHPKCLVN